MRLVVSAHRGEVPEEELKVPKSRASQGRWALEQAENHALVLFARRN